MNSFIRQAVVQQQDAFAEQVRKLAEILERSGNTDAWQTRMQAAIRQNILEQARNVIQARLPNGVGDIAAKLLLQDVKYLNRFRNEIDRKLVTDELSVDGVANRSSLYGRTGIQMAWIIDESLEIDGINEDDQQDLVAIYETSGDGGTCLPCIGAAEASPYPPLQGPFPGAVCFGRSRCRCKRILVVSRHLRVQVASVRETALAGGLNPNLASIIRKFRI